MSSILNIKVLQNDNEATLKATTILQGFIRETAEFIKNKTEYQSFA